MATTTTISPDVSWAFTLRQQVRALWARRETVRYLTTATLKAGHRNKVLGHLWNILDPLMFMLVYFFVFGILFGLAGGGREYHFMLYLLIGVLGYRFIAVTTSRSTICIRSNRGLIHEINFPKAVFPVSVALSSLYDFCWGLLLIVVFLLCGGYWPTIHYLWVPVLVALVVLFSLGVGFWVAYLGAFYADMANVIDVILRLLFYTSPIFYYVRLKPGVPEEHVLMHDHLTMQTIYLLNPVACFLECFRDAMLWGCMPEPRLLLCAVGFTVPVLVIGFIAFGRVEGRFAKYV